MKEPQKQIPPGTRCECFQNRPGHRHESNPTNQFGGCFRDAVRVVTVRIDADEHGPCVADSAIPMCEPCAAWHEAKAGAK